jgi:hypothetical protein
LSKKVWIRTDKIEDDLTRWVVRDDAFRQRTGRVLSTLGSPDEKWDDVHGRIREAQVGDFGGSLQSETKV